MFDARWEAIEQRQIKRRTGTVPRVDPGSRPQPDLPIGTDLLPKIKHIVVLMMENHSYDNYLGMLAGRGDGLACGPDGAPLAANPRRDGSMLRAHHLTSTVQVERVPTQSWNVSHLQVADDRNDGFVTSIEDFVPGADPAVPMGYWTEQDLPFYYGLARTFPLADRWFCSCLGPTFPNRRFMMAGTAHGLIDDLPWDLVDYPEAGTIFDLLTRNGINWVNYHNVTSTRPLLKRALGLRGADRRAPDRPARPAVPGARAHRPRQQVLHRRPVPARAGRLPAPPAHVPAVLRRRGRGHAAAVQHRGPGLRRLLRGEPAGHPEGRELRQRGHQARDARQGVAGHPADLDLRRAGRLLRPRAAPRRGPARRRHGQGPGAGLAGVDTGAAEAVAARRADRAAERRRRAAHLRPVRVARAGGHRLAVRQAGLRDQHGLRPHLDTQADRGEVEPARADPPGRGGHVPAGTRSISTPRPPS